MYNLIKSEFYKLIKNKAFKILILVALIIGLSLTGLIRVIVNNTAKQIDHKHLQQTKAQHYEESANAYKGIQILRNGLDSYIDQTAINSVEMIVGSTNILVMLCLLTIFFFTDDFSSGSIKHIVSKGFSRTKILIVKIITTSMANIIILLIVGISTFTLSLCFWKIGTTIPNAAFYLTRYFFIQSLFIIAYTTLVIMTCMIFRSNLLVISINFILLTFGPYIVNLVNYLLDNKFDFTRYWIFAISEKISFVIKPKDLSNSLIVLVCIILFSVIISLIAFRKKELY